MPQRTGDRGVNGKLPGHPEEAERSVAVSVTASLGGRWSAWVVLGHAEGHATPQEAVDACLAAAKPYLGMKMYGRVADLFVKVLKL